MYGISILYTWRMGMNEEDICYICGQEATGGVCDKCQEVCGSCDCTRLTKDEYQEWLKYKHET